MRELYAKIKYQRLRPKCIVAYTRESFVYLPGNVRITIDTDISGSNNVKEFLNPDLPFLKTYGGSIIEVKGMNICPVLSGTVFRLNHEEVPPSQNMRQ